MTRRRALRAAGVAAAAWALLAASPRAAPGAPAAGTGGSAAGASPLPQEAVDTAGTGTEPPGGAPPRQVVAPDSAQLDTLVADVANKLRCPVCRNQSVLESTATLSREMQSVIREKLAAGETPEQVKAYFVDKYGEWILLRPEAKGIGLLVYVLPALMLLLGGIFVVWMIRRWSSETPAPAAASRSEEEGLEHLPPEEREWLRRELGAG